MGAVREPPLQAAGRAYTDPTTKEKVSQPGKLVFCTSWISRCANCTHWWFHGSGGLGNRGKSSLKIKQKRGTFPRAPFFLRVRSA